MQNRMLPRIATIFASITTAIFLQSCTLDTAASDDRIVSGEARAPLIAGSGTYSRPISTKSEMAQKFFDQGLRFAWGFYFPESIASHQEAARHDPDHPMPYWGMAHAMGPNPNSRYARMPDDPRGEGLKAIKMALERIDRANDVERELINALYLRYDKESIPDDTGRDNAYLDRMRSLNEKYPGDPDIAALFADSYMSIGRWDYWDVEGRAKPGTMRVALALERALKVTPDHPGALHLHIHLLEASLAPERALASADALEATVPVAGHVVHMPAHIYVRVGQYDKAIASNVCSQRVDKEFVDLWGDHPFPNIGTYPLSHRIHTPHAIDFIRYAATIQGNFEVAIEAAQASASMVTGDARDIRNGQKRSSGPWLVYKIFGKWDQLIGQEPGQSGTPYLDGIWAYSVGSAYAATGDLAKAEAELATLETIANGPNADEFRVGASPVSAVLKLASFGLAGEILQAKGDYEGAIAAFEAGVAVEDQNNYTEPPDWAQPMRHYLGAVLLEVDRAADAEAVYRRDLRWNQNNGWSLFGLYQALDMQGRAREAQEVFAEYEASWQNSDVLLARSRL